MRIAQVAPLYESVPPKYYGGTERVVSCLTEELVRQGHDVTLFASGDSETAARLVPVAHRSLRLDKHCIDEFAHHILLLEHVVAAQEDFDVIHFHLGYMHFPIARRLTTPHLSTQHGRLDLADLMGLYSTFRELPNVSISNDQRAPMPWMNWTATVYNGLPESTFRFHESPGDYFAFLGRISPEKRVDRAIEVAKRLKVPLRIAAKVDRVDVEYFETSVHPLLDHPLIEYVGEIGEGEKSEFLGHAGALIFPIDWPEPFGLVMIEALACGTPVIAYRRGSVPEVITHGVDGFIVDSIDDAVTAATSTTIDRRKCRETFERRFSASRMATAYVAAYEQVITSPSSPPALDPRPEAAAISTRLPPDDHGRPAI
ncbi:MAG: glycosyltransferase family 4 protein [Actinomycetota bacterium]